MTESPRLNRPYKTGMNPTYWCAGCNYTVMVEAEGLCQRCTAGEPRPRLDIAEWNEMLEAWRSRGGLRRGR